MNPIHAFRGTQEGQEMKEMSQVTEDMNRSGRKSKKEMIRQIPLPWRKKEHTFDPVFFKCDNSKIVKYESKDLKIWRALLSASHTILGDWDTWNHLSILTVICFTTMAIVIACGDNSSILDNNAVASRIQTLISFVFAGYITIVINRWDRIRNTTFGVVWGCCENLNMVAYKILTKDEDERNQEKTEEAERLKGLILRLSRVIFQLTFLACQSEGDLAPLLEKGLLTDKEKSWLDELTIGTRALCVVNWMYKYFDVLRKKGYDYGDMIEMQIHTNCQNLR
jgi:hypothetical protein